MNEERYAARVRQALNHGLQDISPVASRRLEAARHLAVSRQKQPLQAMAFANGASSSHGSLARHNPLNLPYARQVLAVMALLVGMWLSFYWHSVEYISQIEEVDSALLADDLPPEAFLDNEVFEWLKADD